MDIPLEIAGPVAGAMASVIVWLWKDLKGERASRDTKIEAERLASDKRVAETVAAWSERLHAREEECSRERADLQGLLLGEKDARIKDRADAYVALAAVMESNAGSRAAVAAMATKRESS